MRYSYPAIVACIGEARLPSADEVRRVAKRVRRETYADRAIDASLRRRIMRIALGALGAKRPRSRTEGAAH